MSIHQYSCYKSLNSLYDSPHKDFQQSQDNLQQKLGQTKNQISRNTLFRSLELYLWQSQREPRPCFTVISVRNVQELPLSVWSSQSCYALSVTAPGPCLLSAVPELSLSLLDCATLGCSPALPPPLLTQTTPPTSSLHLHLHSLFLAETFKYFSIKSLE